MKVICASFLYLQFVFVIFWQKEIGEEASHKMLVKLATKQAKKKKESIAQFPQKETVRV